MNVYGPRQDYKGAYIAVIMKMLDAIDRGEGPTILGDGSEAFDFVAVEDCARANSAPCRPRRSTGSTTSAPASGRRSRSWPSASSAHRLQPADRLCAAQPGDAGAQPHRRSGAASEGDRVHAGSARRRTAPPDRVARRGQAAARRRRHSPTGAVGSCQGVRCLNGTWRNQSTA